KTKSKTMNTIQNKSHIHMKVLAVALTALAVISGHAEAQVRKPAIKPGEKKKIARPLATESKPVERIVNISSAADGVQPVAIVNSPQPDFLYGEANVTVNPKQPTI